MSWPYLIKGVVIHRSESGHTGDEVARRAPGAYHLFVRKDGTTDLVLGDLGFEVSGAHAVGFNRISVAIAVYGCFIEAPPGIRYKNQRPTQAQLDSVELLILGLKWWLGRDLWVMGHTELPKASRDPSKVCPGPYFPLDAIRAHTKSARLISSSAASSSQLHA